jgi:RIO-like serine/threonine protein kinase
MLISNNGVSKVWEDSGWIYKQQPKYLTDNEIWALISMFGSGYVPYAEQVDTEIIRIMKLSSKKVTNPKVFMGHLDRILEAMQEAGIRHGDLTEPHVFVIENKPKIIDWGESRVTCDPRLDKRREGDKFWLTKTMNELTERSGWKKPQTN